VLADLDGRIPFIVDGGPCQVGIESTVLGLFDETPRILRPGAITAEHLEPHLGQVLVEAGSRHSPGARYRHYQPRSPVILTGPEIDARALCERLSGAALIDRGATLPAHLYADLRALDGADWIVVQGIDPRAAVMERAQRAARHVLWTAADLAAFLAAY
jgi:hypothetical protein